MVGDEVTGRRPPPGGFPWVSDRAVPRQGQERRNGRWAGAWWALAAATAAGSLWFPVFTVRAPLVSNLDPNQPRAYAVTTFDAWGGSTTTTDGAGLSFQVPGGPNYAASVLACLVVLVTAVALGVRSRSALASLLTSVGGPVASGALGAIAVCQLLAYGAAVRPSPPGGVYGGGEQRPEGELGWCVWLLAASAVMAVAASVRLLAPSRSPTSPPPVEPEPEPSAPVSAAPSELADPPPPAVADPDPAIFRRPTREDPRRERS